MTLLIHESTDITNNKCLVVYVQIIDPVSLYQHTHFFANEGHVDTTGVGIAKCIQEMMSELEIPLNKIMSMGSDEVAATI